jgi:hypothetical protein
VMGMGMIGNENKGPGTAPGPRLLGADFSLAPQRAQPRRV